MKGHKIVPFEKVVQMRICTCGHQRRSHGSSIVDKMGWRACRFCECQGWDRAFSDEELLMAYINIARRKGSKRKGKVNGK